MIINKIFLSIIFLIIPIFIVKILNQYIIKTSERTLLNLFLKLLLFIELLRILYLLIFQKFNLITDLPLQLCYLIIILIFIELFHHKDYLLDYIIISSTLFGVIAIFLYPHTIDKFLVFIGYLYHSIMFLLGLCFLKKQYIPKKENTLKITIILLIQLAILYIINNLINSNYGFLKIIFNPEVHINDPFLSFYYQKILSFSSMNYYILNLKNKLTIFYIPFIILLMYCNYKILINLWIYKIKIRKNFN